MAVSGRGRQRLATLGAVVLLAAPVLLLAYVAYDTVASDAARRSADERGSSSELAARLIQLRLHEAGEHVQLLASRPTFRSALRERDGATLARYLAPYVADLRRVGVSFSSAAILDAKGIMLASDPATPDVIGRDFSSRDYFAGGMRSSEPFVSEAYASGSPLTILVGVSFAVREGSQTLGLVQFALAADQVLSDVVPVRELRGRELFIVDKRGHVIASTDPSFAPLAPVELPGLEAALAGGEGTVTVRLSNDDRIVTYRGIAGVAWALYFVDRASDVFAVERRLAGGMALAGLLASGAAVLIAFVVSRLNQKLRVQRDELAASHAALVDANVRLEAASRQKSDFLSGMSHELRTPMNAILGFSELLREQLAGSLTERQLRYFRNIADAGQHLLTLINDVLDLSKVEAGKTELRPEVIELRALVEPVAAAARQTASERELRFDASVQEDALVRVDSGRVRQVLYNLASNALKFTPAGGKVSLTAGLDRDDLHLEVRDTGIGIPAHLRERVFGVFERLNEGRSMASGTGLGLALTKQLVELHGGSIEFESEENVGSTFRVRLPGVSVQVVTGDRVLVIEDESRDADLIVELASAAGLRTEVVGSAASARAAIQRNPPIGVVLDLRLPDERGEVILEKLRSDRAMRRTPVIVVTVEDDDGHLQRLGADDHLTKPIDHARLAGWLARVAQAQLSEVVAQR